MGGVLSNAEAGDGQTRDDFFGAYSHRIEGVTVGAGDAPRSNAASQMINPWPVYSGRRSLHTESPRMIGAIRRYNENSAAGQSDQLDGGAALGDSGPEPDTGKAPSTDASVGE